MRLLLVVFGLIIGVPIALLIWFLARLWVEQDYRFDVDVVDLAITRARYPETVTLAADSEAFRMILAKEIGRQAAYPKTPYPFGELWSGGPTVREELAARRSFAIARTTGPAFEVAGGTYCKIIERTDYTRTRESPI